MPSVAHYYINKDFSLHFFFSIFKFFGYISKGQQKSKISKLCWVFFSKVGFSFPKGQYTKVTKSCILKHRPFSLRVLDEWINKCYNDVFEYIIHVFLVHAMHIPSQIYQIPKLWNLGGKKIKSPLKYCHSTCSPIHKWIGSLNKYNNHIIIETYIG